MCISSCMWVFLCYICGHNCYINGRKCICGCWSFFFFLIFFYTDLFCILSLATEPKKTQISQVWPHNKKKPLTRWVTKLRHPFIYLRQLMDLFVYLCQWYIVTGRIRKCFSTRWHRVHLYNHVLCLHLNRPRFRLSKLRQNKKKNHHYFSIYTVVFATLLF